MAKQTSQPPKRILIVPLRYIGDTVVSVPLIREMRQRFPDALIDVLVSPASEQLLAHCPYVNTLLPEPSSRGLSKLSDTLRLVKENNYTYLVTLRKSFTMALLGMLAGIPNRFGYDKQRYPFGFKRWGLGLTKSVRYPSLRTETPQTLSHLSMLSLFNPSDKTTSSEINSSLELWTDDVDQQRLNACLVELGLDVTTFNFDNAVVVNVTSASHGKNIALEKFIPAIQRVLRNGKTIFFTGIKDDVSQYETLIRLASLEHAVSNKTVVNLAGKTNLRQTVALYQRVPMMLTVDSGPMHLAAAAGIKNIVGVFGPTNDVQWQPWFGDQSLGEQSKANQRRFEPVFVDLPCRPCYAKICSHNNCRVTMTADQIDVAMTKLSS